MAAGKEIRGKIKSVENTKKITKAMEMVSVVEDEEGAGAHARGAAVRRAGAQPRRQPLARDARVQAPVPDRRTTTPRRAGFIVVTTDKGLCGGLNTNVLRAVTAKLQGARSARALKAEAVAIGSKGLGFLNRIGAKVVSHVDPARRPAAARQADRPGQGAARRLRRGQAQGRLPLLHALHQHDAPGAGDRAAAAAHRASRCRWKTASTAGTTSTSPTRQVVIDELLVALRRGAGLPGRGREHGLRAVGARWWR